MFEHPNTGVYLSPRKSQKGFAYQAEVLRWMAVCVAVLLMFHFGLAQESPSASPKPRPTDAVLESGQTLTVEGRASLKQGLVAARYAALLDAYGQVLKYGLHHGIFAGHWNYTSDEFRFFRVDADHPAPEVVSFLSRSKILSEEEAKDQRVVTLETPEMVTVASSQPFMRSMVTQDVDQDGLSDVVAVGYDGSVYILKSPKSTEAKIVGRSKSFALFEIVSGPGYERVRAVFPQGVGKVEMVDSGQVRMLLELEILEMVNGRLLGRATENREVLVSLTDQLEKIRFSITQPQDFSIVSSPDAELLGTAISEEILENVDIRHNGTFAWESPPGLAIRALQFNLTRTLVPGWNNFRITARDSEGFMELREIWLQGPDRAPAAASSPKSKRAVLVSLDKKFKGERVEEALAEMGFPPRMVTVLEGDQVSASDLVAALREDLGAEELFFYCASLTQPGTLIGGKSLRFPDRELEAAELAQAFEAAGYKKVVGLFHSELPRDQRAQFDEESLWRDTAAFLDRVGGAGRVMVGNIENADEGTRTQRKRSRERLEEALKAASGSDLSRLLQGATVNNLIFRGWMYGPSVLAR